MDPTIAGTSVDVLADSAYGSGEMLAALAGTAHTPVIKPWPLRPAVEGGFTLDDFTVDEAAGTATCPNDVTRNITAKRRVTFGAVCTGLPTPGPVHRLTAGTKARTPRTRRAAARTPSTRRGPGLQKRLPHT